MKPITTLFTLLAIATLCFLIQPISQATPRVRASEAADSAQDKSKGEHPIQALIQGVPFLSFSEASRLKYPDKDVVNPAIMAMVGMILQYWGQDLSGVTKMEKKG